MFLNGLRILGGALLGYFYGDQGFGQDNQQPGNNFGQIGFFVIIALVVYLIIENFKKK